MNLLKECLLKELINSDIEEPIKDFLLSSRPGIIFGAGRQVRLVIDFCMMFQKRYECLITTESKNRWGLLPQKDEELPLYLLKEFPPKLDKSQYDIIIGVGSGSTQIREMLLSEGFQNVFAVKDWNSINNEIRRLFYHTYLRYHDVKIIEESEMGRYLEYHLEEGSFRLFYPDDEVFEANVWGEFNNIVMPSIFNDFSVLCLGPYEYENVMIEKDDIVFDLGANVGLFACVAASKGKKVYAFEPTVSTVEKYLKKNARLYDKIVIIDKAVGEKNEIVPFYYNDDLTVDKNTCRNSFHRDFEPTFKETMVEKIALDDFVEKNNIGRVDFIKSFTEYAEDIMLMGAQNILKKFSPKLSFYSQKAMGLDNYKEIEKLILKANPDYQFTYRWRRMYAYVPVKKGEHYE